MHLTVGICTWNRARLLDQTLASMLRVRVPDSVRWELLIINNKCTDETDRVIGKYEAHLPVRRIFEPQLGKSFALNRLVREARGDYILLTDDDVLVHRDWIVAYSRAFVRWPNASVFGGPIRPWYFGTPPEWLNKVFPYVAGAYGVRDLGSKHILLNETTAPYGANVGIRVRDQVRFLYDTTLGPRGSYYSTGEDTEMIRKMMAEGIEGRWVPDAIIYHCIPESRQTLSYIGSYYQGYGDYFARQARQGGGLMLFGKPRIVWRQMIGVPVKYFKYRIRRSARTPEEWIRDFIAFNIAWGMLTGGMLKGSKSAWISMAGYSGDSETRAISGIADKTGLNSLLP